MDGCIAGHTDSVTGVSVSADGDKAATVSCDGTARVWNLATGNCLAVLQHSRGTHVSLASFMGDGTCLATCSADCTPMLWELATSRCLHKLEVRCDHGRLQCPGGACQEDREDKEGGCVPGLSQLPCSRPSPIAEGWLEIPRGC